MAKSKQRKGHSKRINARKVQAKAAQNYMQKLFNEAMKAQIEELKKESENSGTTENQL
jgi:cytochrome c-type biogenesis protein CcmE